MALFNSFGINVILVQINTNPLLETNSETFIFFLEHAGELRIIVLIEEGWSHTERPPHTPTHTQTRGGINRLLHVRATQDPGQEHPSQQP